MTAALVKIPNTDKTTLLTPTAMETVARNPRPIRTLERLQNDNFLTCQRKYSSIKKQKAMVLPRMIPSLLLLLPILPINPLTPGTMPTA